MEIKIIHKKDTMYINQISGYGSIVDINEFEMNTNKVEKQTTDFTLQFIAGHYYFPEWAKKYFKNLPKTNGTVRIVNADQRHFIIPKTLYDSIYNRKFVNIDRYQLYKRAEDIVVKNFMSGYYSIEEKLAPIRFDRSIVPFKKSWETWSSPYYSTNNENEYLYIVELNYDTLNYSGGRGMIGIYNYEKNLLKFWSMTKNLKYSSTYSLKHDTFNKVFYNQTIIYDASCKDVIYKCDYDIKFHESKDEGTSWTDHNKLTQLYKKHRFRELEFLDQNHALIFKLDQLKLEKNPFNIQQGKYYLLKNFIIIDSLKTPNDLDYNDNYNRYGYNVVNDSISLVKWTYDKYYNIGKTKYTQPNLIKTNNQWKFKLNEKIYSEVQNKPLNESINYGNLNVLNGTISTLSGQLHLDKEEFSKITQQGLFLQNNNEIYLLGLSFGTLFSFNGGFDWYIYPLQLNDSKEYNLLELNDEGIITYLKHSYENVENSLDKVSTKFIKIND